MKETMTKKIYLINFLPNKFILIEMKKYSQKKVKMIKWIQSSIPINLFKG